MKLDVSGADLARSREQDRARAIMSGMLAVKPVDYSQPTVKLPSPTRKKQQRKGGRLGAEDKGFVNRKNAWSR